MEQVKTHAASAAPRRTVLLHFAFALLALAFAVLATGPALAAGGMISDQEAYALQQQDRLVLVDVRTEGEWRQTGVAEGAVPISMQDPQFMLKFTKLRTAAPDKQIAFVCASGRRSGIVQSELAKRGYENLFTVVGGMTGNGQQKGWIADDLPTQRWTGAGD